MIKTQLIKPSACIAGYVSHLMVIECKQVKDDFVLPLFANGNPTLVFQTCTGYKNHESVDHVTLYGQTVTPVNLVIKESFTLIACFFHPYALTTLFHQQASTLTDVAVDADLLPPAKTMRLKEQLLNASSLEQRLLLLENFIVRLACTNSKKNERIIYATNQLNKSNGLCLLTDLQHELNITERTFQRLFETEVGISPKMYRRICQFNAAFQQLNNRGFIKLSDIAYDNGFADQSHFVRVFKEFTHLTPKEYLGRISALNS